MLRKLLDRLQRPLQSAARHGALVDAAYQYLLGRPADPGGRAHFIQELAAGRLTPAALLQQLAHSEEACSQREAMLSDPALASRTPVATKLWQNLSACNALPQAAFDTLWQALYAPGRPLIIGQADYATQHRRRYHEMANAVRVLLADTPAPAPRLLEFGVSEFSAAWHRIQPDLTVHLADRPVPEDYIGFTAARAREKLGCDDFFYADLSEPEILPVTRKGQYHLVLCTEVIEHLIVAPVTLLRCLLGLLAPGGHLYLTTPNLYRRDHLAAMARREAFLPAYPGAAGNWDAHHHHHEFCGSEMLQAIEMAGGTPVTYGFSGCWDSATSLPEAQRGNMVFIIAAKSL